MGRARAGSPAAHCEYFAMRTLAQHGGKGENGCVGVSRLSIPARSTARRKKEEAMAPLRLAPARRRTGETVQEFAFRRLRHAIMTGRFPPGLAVTIRGLAELLGVSAMPVREAMRRLVAERALDLLDNRRVRVPEMTAPRFDALIAARILLECEAARQALPQLNAQAVAELRRLDAAADEVFARGDVERTIEANFAFHKHLYSLAPSDALTPLIESIWLQIGPFMRAALNGATVYNRADRHAEAMAAIETGDAAALARAIEADVRDGIGHISLAPAVTRPHPPETAIAAADG
jgi:DNA-binding GntR family transcriptional regulator